MGKYTLKVEGIYKEAFPNTIKRLSFVVGLEDFLSFYEKSIKLGNVEKAFFSSFDELTQKPVFYDEGVHVISGGVPWMALYDDRGDRVSEVSVNAGTMLYDGVDVSDDSGFYEENLFAVLTSIEGSRKVEDDGSVVVFENADLPEAGGKISLNPKLLLTMESFGFLSFFGTEINGEPLGKILQPKYEGITEISSFLIFRMNKKGVFETVFSLESAFFSENFAKCALER